MSAGRLRPVSALAAVTCLVAVGITWPTRDFAPMGSVSVPWLAIAAAYAMTEMCLVHFEHRNEAQSLSFSAVPLVVGLYVLSAPLLILARLAGSAFALVIHRRQTPLKLFLNISAFWLGDVLAILAFRSVVADGAFGPATWLAAIVAAVVSDQVQGLVVMLAISLHQRRLEILNGPVLLGPVSTVVNAGLAIVAVTLLEAEPMALVLLGLAVPVLIVSYRVHARLLEQHRNLEQLYAFTRRISESVVDDRVIATLLDQVRELMHADSAWLCIDDGGSMLHISCRPDGADPEAALMPAGSIDDLLHRRAHDHGQPLLVTAANDTELHHGLRDLGARQVLIAPIGMVGGSPATVVVADRSGEVRDFGADDLRLFATLVGHAATTLENDHLVDQLRVQAAESEFQALHDALTGLPNRSMFGQRLVEALESGKPAAVLLLDLDRFKEVNDTLGHHNGDVLLRSVADRLRDAVDSSAMVARFGGDEFSILLPDAGGVAEVIDVARAINATLEAPLAVANLEVVVGASIGIAMTPEHGTDVATLLSRADIAMYAAKTDRSGVEVYDVERDDHSPDRLVLAGRIREAIEHGDLAVHFQPQMSLATGAVIGAEALVRWDGDPTVRISPAELVAIAENTGLIRRLTMHVLERAIRECRRWRDGGRELRVSVNLSAHDLLDSGLVDDVLELLIASDVPPSALCLELTETSVMADPTRTIAVLQDLHRTGIEIAVDDFGTGYSSLSYLSQLPVDEVKIDRSFVMGMDEDAGDEVIVRSVVDLGRNLRLRVVAEGIETEEARQRLCELGCTAGQGYLFSRPLPADEFASWLTGADAHPDRLVARTA